MATEFNAQDLDARLGVLADAVARLVEALTPGGAPVPFAPGIVPGFPGLGHPNIIGVPNPAGGADWTLTPPPGAVWRVIAGVALLTTSATVGSRAACLKVTVGGVTVLYSPPSSTSGQAAGLTYLYCYQPAYNTQAPAANSPAAGAAQTVPIPPGLIIDNRYRLQSDTANLAGGGAPDQWKSIAFLVEELVPAPPE